jgi:hypothetical protein
MHWTPLFLHLPPILSTPIHSIRFSSHLLQCTINSVSTIWTHIYVIVALLDRILCQSLSIQYSLFFRCYFFTSLYSHLFFTLHLLLSHLSHFSPKLFTPFFLIRVSSETRFVRVSRNSMRNKFRYFAKQACRFAKFGTEAKKEVSLVLLCLKRNDSVCFARFCEA